MSQVREKRVSSSPAMIERHYKCTRKGSRRPGTIIFCGLAAEAVFEFEKSHALRAQGRGGESSSTTVRANSGAHKSRPGYVTVIILVLPNSLSSYAPSGEPGPRSMGKRRTSNVALLEPMIWFVMYYSWQSHYPHMSNHSFYTFVIPFYGFDLLLQRNIDLHVRATKITSLKNVLCMDQTTHVFSMLYWSLREAAERADVASASRRVRNGSNERISEW
jgi:hypothetical protein